MVEQSCYRIDNYSTSKMRLSSIPSLLLLLPAALAAAPNDRTITVYTWPFKSNLPSSLAQVTYNPDTSVASFSKYTPPEGPYNTTDRLRVGLYDPKTTEWRGILTSIATFDPDLHRTLSLHLAPTGEVYHIDLSAHGRKLSEKELKRKRRIEERTKKNADKLTEKGRQKAAKQFEEEFGPPAADLNVEIVPITKAPKPILNKPVMLNAEGKLPSGEQEKTFLQKYWWAIALFMLLQFVITPQGADDDKKKK